MPHIRRMGYLLILIIGAALVTAMAWHPAPPKPFVGIAGADVPRTLSGYESAGNDPVPADVKAALASASLLSRTYTSEAAGSNGEPINFVLIGGTDRSALHDPRSCLIGAGMRLEDDHLEALPGTSVAARSCHAVSEHSFSEHSFSEHSFSASGSGGSDLLYLYVVDGKIINQATQIRAAMLWSALLGQQGKPVYFLRFERPINPEAGADALGHARLQQFATAMWMRLRPKLLASIEITRKHGCFEQNHCRGYRVS